MRRRRRFSQFISAVVGPVLGTFWHTNYWHGNYWHTNYWAKP